MVLVYVTISPNGVHGAEVEAAMDEAIEAQEFYRRLKPLLRDLDQEVRGATTD